MQSYKLQELSSLREFSNNLIFNSLRASSPSCVFSGDSQESIRNRVAPRQVGPNPELWFMQPINHTNTYNIQGDITPSWALLCLNNINKHLDTKCMFIYILTFSPV